MTLRSSLMLAAVFWLSAYVGAPVVLSRKPLSSKWVLIAKSDLIVRAKLNIQPHVSKEDQAGCGWIDLNASIEETVKGHIPGQTLTIRYWETLEGPPLSSFEESAGQEVVLFLIEGQRGADRSYYFFADHTPDVVIPFSSEVLSTIASEVENQQEIAQHFNDLPFVTVATTDATIRRMLEGLVQKQTQEAAWGDLLKLSRNDAPAIVRNMIDFRPIPDFDAYLPNPRGASEAVAHYSPHRVIEAALLVLQFITQIGFRRYESNTQQEWLSEINGWRCWCAYNF